MDESMEKRAFNVMSFFATKTLLLLSCFVDAADRRTENQLYTMQSILCQPELPCSTEVWGMYHLRGHISDAYTELGKLPVQTCYQPEFTETFRL